VSATTPDQPASERRDGQVHGSNDSCRTCRRDRSPRAFGSGRSDCRLRPSRLRERDALRQQWRQAPREVLPSRRTWGHRFAVSTRKGGDFYGYKVDLAVCTRTGLPVAWQARTAKHHESLFVADLLDAVRARGIQPETVALDKGYDVARVYDEIEVRGCDPVIPMKGAKGKQVALPVATGGRLFPRIARHTERFRDLYVRRVAVEREFGRLKTLYGLSPLRVRGLERVQLHADLTMLARLALASHRTSVVVA
jgi:hypothetical protein